MEKRLLPFQHTNKEFSPLLSLFSFHIQKSSPALRSELKPSPPTGLKPVPAIFLFSSNLEPPSLLPLDEEPIENLSTNQNFVQLSSSAMRPNSGFDLFCSQSHPPDDSQFPQSHDLLISVFQVGTIDPHAPPVFRTSEAGHVYPCVRFGRIPVYFLLPQSPQETVLS